ncbi:MAG: quinolinate synthase NadA [Deltaproteobacteria bacterium]|nr:quinolinate synthase NadA [Deltaproteobacteria bacterium]
MNTLSLQKKIRKLLSEKNAVLLAHYYQRREIQDIADILGDSLALSLGAAKTGADIIVFAGVHFMAESASILCPDKTVLLPRLEAGCPLADMANAEQLTAAKRDNPGAMVVTYINSSAETKALSDICCTSSNAVNVVNSLNGDKKIIMVPDGNLARYTSRITGKKIMPWNGHCPVHQCLSGEDVITVKAMHPRALFAAHPECRAEVLAMANFVGSTGKILNYARECDAGELIVGTEQGILYQLQKQNPGKSFIPASPDMVCRTMKCITLEDILTALREMKYIIKVPDEIRIPAKRALDRMLAIS